MYIDWFWLFILGISVAAIAAGIMRSMAREKTIRTAIEKGVALDPTTLDALRSHAVSTPASPRFGLTVGAIMTFFIGIGLGLMSIFVGMEDHMIIWPMVGVGGLLWCISAGLFVASRVAPAPRP